MWSRTGSRQVVHRGELLIADGEPPVRFEHGDAERHVGENCV
jgi:hypothetical protein